MINLSKTGISRRGLVKAGGLAALGGAACAGAALADEAPAAAFESTVPWDAEYDVVVVGFGIAGASTALTASREGARVLLLEKAPKALAGGNSRVCGQRIGTVAPEAREDAVAYCKALRGEFDTPSDEIIDAFVNGLMENESWVTEVLGQGDWVEIGSVDFPDYPGAGSIVNKTTLGTKGFNAQTYHGAQECVLADTNIEVWYGAPATRLVQDPATRIVHGVVVDAGGQEVKVRAVNGVVMTCGGFEGNDRMIQDYCLRPHLPAVGAMLNTGDGITMIGRIGGGTWHLSNLVIDIETIFPDTGVVTFGAQTALSGTGAIFVGPDGTRFMNESSKPHHGKVDFHGDSTLLPFPTDMWAIFDQTMVKDKIYPKFSDGNVDEIASGMLVSGDSLEELAQNLGIDPEGLVKTVEEWNQALSEGADVRFGRNLEKVPGPFGDGPYYGLKIYAGIINTMGGAQRNERGEILDIDGSPIPHLFAAGEFGDLWPRDYQGSTNFGGGMVFGRISGRNAAAPKDDVSQESMMGGREPFVYENAADPVFEAGEGELIGQAWGMGGTPLVVKVVLGDDGAIASVEVLSHSETPSMSNNAFKLIPQRIVDANGTTDVDCKTGATVTSTAICKAVENALATR